MLTEILKQFFARELEKLKAEIAAYKNEISMWIIAEGISNSGGNLCLHLIGNLNHFIGKELGSTGYVRERELEFSLKDIAKADLLKQIDETATMVQLVLDKLPEADMTKEYPLLILEKRLPTGLFLTHLVTHLSYHLGQINYHRRLLDKE